VFFVLEGKVKVFFGSRRSATRTSGRRAGDFVSPRSAPSAWVPLAHVVVLGGDTELVGFGMGTIASRVAAVAGPAVAKSADEVARRA